MRTTRLTDPCASGRAWNGSKGGKKMKWENSSTTVLQVCRLSLCLLLRPVPLWWRLVGAACRETFQGLTSQRYTATAGMIWWSGHTYFILIEEHLQLPHADTQIGLVELVGDVPAQRSKLAALLDQSVEEAQAVQHLVEVDLRRHTTHWSPPTSPNLSWILLSLMQLHREHLPIKIILIQWNILMEKAVGAIRMDAFSMTTLAINSDCQNCF